MESKPEENVRLSLDEFLEKAREPVELQGRKFVVKPISLASIQELGRKENGIEPRELGIKALRDSVISNERKISEEDLKSLGETCLQDLAKQVLVRSGLGAGGDDYLAELGGKVSNRDMLYTDVGRWGKLPGFLSESVAERLMQDVRGFGAATDKLDALTSKFALSQAERDPVREFDHKTLASIIDPSVTPAGRAARAAEETAELTQEMLLAMGEMTRELGELTATMLSKVMPQWMEHIEKVEADAKLSADRANKSLWWASAAVVVSVLSSLGTTAFQYYGAGQDQIAFEVRADAFEAMGRSLLTQDRELLDELIKLRHEQFDQLSAIRHQIEKSAVIAKNEEGKKD